MARFVLLVGISAAGKSTFGRMLAENIPNSVLVPVGKEKQVVMKELGVEKSLSRLTQTESLKVSKAFFEKIFTQFEPTDKNVFLAAHATYTDTKTKDAFQRLVPVQILERVDSIIFLKIPPKIAVQRRNVRKKPTDVLSISKTRQQAIVEGLDVKKLGLRGNIPILVLKTSSKPFTGMLAEVKKFLKMVPLHQRQGKKVTVYRVSYAGVERRKKQRRIALENRRKNTVPGSYPITRNNLSRRVGLKPRAPYVRFPR